jgi:hypothetical protein
MARLCLRVSARATQLTARPGESARTNLVESRRVTPVCTLSILISSCLHNDSKTFFVSNSLKQT